MELLCECLKALSITFTGQIFVWISAELED